MNRDYDDELNPASGSEGSGSDGKKRYGADGGRHSDDRGDYDGDGDFGDYDDGDGYGGDSHADGVLGKERENRSHSEYGGNSKVRPEGSRKEDGDGYLAGGSDGDVSRLRHTGSSPEGRSENGRSEGTQRPVRQPGPVQTGKGVGTPRSHPEAGQAGQRAGTRRQPGAGQAGQGAAKPQARGQRRVPAQNGEGNGTSARPMSGNPANSGITRTQEDARSGGYVARRRAGQEGGLQIGDHGDRISGSGDRRGQEPPSRLPVSRSASQASKRRKIRRVIIMASLEVVFLVCIGFYGYALRLNSLVKRPAFDKNRVMNEQLSKAQAEHMKGYWTIAIFGVDSRDGNVHKGTNTDVIMLCNINRDTGEIKLVSVFRDTYLNTNEKGTYNKINSAFANGGAEQALSALNRNLDLNIVDYVTFNWKSVAEGINMLGGVDGVDISKAEFRYINSFITETVNKTGVGSVQLKKPGVQHLDGIQAVAYGRLRLMDTDFARTERQRLIIQKTFDKAKIADLGLLNRILMMEVSQIESSLTFSDFTDLILDLGKYHIGETGGFPFARGDMRLAKKGDCVIPQTLESNVKELHKFLYDKSDYEPTSMVKKISAKIAADTGSYKVGNDVGHVPTDKGYIKETQETKVPAKETKEHESTSGGEMMEETDSAGRPIRPVLPGETLPDGSRPTKPGETLPSGVNPTRPGETLPNGVNPTSPGETLPDGSIRPGESIPDNATPGGQGELNPNNPSPTSPVTPGMSQSNPGGPGGGGQSNPSDSHTGPGVQPTTSPSGNSQTPGTSQNQNVPGGGPTGPGNGGSGNGGPGNGSGGINPGSDSGTGSGGSGRPGSTGQDVIMVPPPAA